MSFRRRAAAFWGRHRSLFWMLHSVWALATGVVVLLLAWERYAFVPWVVVFLGLTWLSTLFFGSSAREEWTPTLGGEVSSYVRNYRRSSGRVTAPAYPPTPGAGRKSSSAGSANSKKSM